MGRQLLVHADQAEDPAAGRAASRASLRAQVGHDRAERVTKLTIRGRRGGGAGTDEVHVVRRERRGLGGHDGAQPPAHPVAGDGATDPTADGVARRAGARQCPQVRRSRSGLLGGGVIRPRARGTRHGLEQRQIRPTRCRGPWPDADGSRRDPHGSACGDGSRASSSASGCSAGTSSSRMASSKARADGGLGRGRGHRGQGVAPAQRRSAGTGARRAGGQCSVRVAGRGAAIRPIRTARLGNTPLRARFPRPERVDSAPDDPLVGVAAAW